MKSRSKKATESDIDGGWGWAIVGAGFVVYTIVFGSLRCQSVFFVPIIDEFSSDFAQTAWVSSIATGGFSIAGMLAAPLISRIGHRPTVILGGMIAATATFCAAFSPSLQWLYVSAGVLTGLGMGIAFVPSPVIIGHYFKTRRSLATNIASVGASIGTLALCPFSQVLISEFGLRGCYMIYGGFYLNICVAGALIRPPPTQKAMDQIQETAEGELENYAEEKDAFAVQIADPEAAENDSDESKTKRCCTSPLFKNIPYIVYCISQVIFLGGFIGYQLYIVPYAEVEVGIPKIDAAFLMSISAFIEIGSRILFGLLGDVKWIDRIWLFCTSLLVMAICCALFPFMKSFVSLCLISALSGLFQGGFGGMSVVILVDIVGLKYYGIGLGVSTLLNGIGTLLTPPAIGMATDITGKPSTALYISAGLLFLGAFLSAMIKVAIKYFPPPNYEDRHGK